MNWHTKNGCRRTNESPNLVDLVKAYAFAHCEEESWDIVIECYSDDEIAEIIKGAQTEAEAIDIVEHYLD